MRHKHIKALTAVTVLAVTIMSAVVVPMRHPMDRHDADAGVLLQLPKKLHFLIGPALKYGRYQFPADISSFASQATPLDREELAGVRQHLEIDDNYEEVALFLDKYEMTKYPEAAKLYFLLNVVDAVIGAPPPIELTRDYLTQVHLKALSRFGSPRLKANRMFAAKWFVNNPPIPPSAIPLLEKALRDESMHVRLWAHGAMAIIHGNPEEQIQKIEQIVALIPETDNQYIQIQEDARKVIEIIRSDLTKGDGGRFQAQQ